MTSTLSNDFPSRLVGSYLASLSSATPSPGGGSAAGLTGAMGCALGQMVCNLTLAREPSDELSSLADTLGVLGADLLQLAERDERVFASYREATALPRTTDEEKTSRHAAIESTLFDAADVPMQMISIGLNAFDALRLAAMTGTPHAVGDVLTGGFLMQAMILGSLENVEANVALMKTEAHQSSFTYAANSARTDLARELEALQVAVDARRA